MGNVVQLPVKPRKISRLRSWRQTMLESIAPDERAMMLLMLDHPVLFLGAWLLMVGTVFAVIWFIHYMWS